MIVIRKIRYLFVSETIYELVTLLVSIICIPIEQIELVCITDIFVRIFLHKFLHSIKTAAAKDELYVCMVSSYGVAKMVENLLTNNT